MSDTTLAPVPTASDTDASALSHIVNCPDDKESTAAWLTEARIYGLEVTALCGHRWIPSRDPLKHPICVLCVDAANIIVGGVVSRRRATYRRRPFRMHPAVAGGFLSLFFTAVYIATGQQGFNGLSLLIVGSVFLMFWGVYTHLDHEVQTARQDWEAARAAIAANEALQ